MERWKYIDLDPAEVERVKHAYLTKMPNTSHFFNTIDVGIKDFMGMPLFKTVLINSQPRSVGVIHVDYQLIPHSVLAINIPLINCDEAKTCFWDTTEDVNKVSFTTNGAPYTNFSFESCTKVDEFILTQPAVIRVDVPHSVNNPSFKNRLAISLRFLSDPWDLINV